MNIVLVTYKDGTIERFTADRTFVDDGFYIIVLEDGHTVSIPGSNISKVESSRED